MEALVQEEEEAHLPRGRGRGVGFILLKEKVSLKNLTKYINVCERESMDTLPGAAPRASCCCKDKKKAG